MFLSLIVRQYLCMCVRVHACDEVYTCVRVHTCMYMYRVYVQQEVHSEVFNKCCTSTYR